MSPLTAEAKNNIELEKLESEKIYRLEAKENGRTFIAGFIYVIKDKDNNVTCWIFRDSYKGGISCIPDSQLTPLKREKKKGGEK